MRTINLLLVALASAAIGAGATLGAQKKMQSAVFEWTSGDAKPNNWGAVRQVVRTATPTLDKHEIHITTLNPGQSPHPPHQHQHEELQIVKEGTLETFQRGETRRVGPGGIIFQASNEMHNVPVVVQSWNYWSIGWPFVKNWRVYRNPSNAYSYGSQAHLYYWLDR